MIDLTRPEIALDTETTGLDTVRGVGDIHCCAFVNDEQTEIAIGVKETKVVVEYLLDEGYNLVFHNAAYDVPTLRQFGINVPPDRYICTMVGAHKINPQLPSISLDYLGTEWSGSPKVDYGAAMVKAGMWDGNKKNMAALWSIPYNDEMRDYCIHDTLLAWRLRKLQREHFDADSRLAKSYYEIHLPFIEVMISLQNGLHVNQELALTTLQDMIATAERNQTAFLQKHPNVVKLSWDADAKTWKPKQPPQLVEFNPGSPNDVASLMLTHGFVSDELTPTGRPQYSQAVLKRKAGDEETPKDLADLCSELSEINSVNGIINQLMSVATKSEYVSDVGGHILYGSWQQCGAVTHRMSSSKP
jgi:3'-5' exonuclease